MFKKLLALFCVTTPIFTFAASDGWIIPKLNGAKAMSTTNYAYVPFSILSDGTNGSQFGGSYKSYVQNLKAEHGISYSHFLNDVSDQLKQQGFNIVSSCEQNCSTKPYKDMIEGTFRYNGIYQVGFNNARKNTFGYLSALRVVEGKQQSVLLFAKNDYKNNLVVAYEQAIERDMPSSGVNIKHDFKVEPLDLSKLKARRKDERNTFDHPMIERFPGSYIAGTSVNDFESYPLIVGAYKKSIPTKDVSGKITTISYRIDPSVGPYAVHKNYLNALQGADFSIIFECGASDCGNYLLRDNLKNTIHARNHKADFYNLNKKSHYYFFTAEKITPTGKVYVSMYSYQKGGKFEVHTVVDIIEERAMSKVALNVDSDTLSKQIQATGSVSLYGIEFDFDKHTLKASSHAQLQEIADFLKRSEEISLYVVGHTDNKGEFSYNRDLSERRAAEVVKTLANKYQIDTARLQAIGVGPAAPKAANDSEPNMQQNRRVELVLKSPLSL